jgi:HSP20 family protein
MRFETTNNEIQRERNGAFERAQAQAGSVGEFLPTSAPAVDVYEGDDEILVVADMPGARPESVTVKLEKDELFISAKRDTDVGGQLLFGTRRDCEYRRTFLVPRGIDGGAITAEMSQGVLKVHLPKSAAVKPRTIEVKARN